MADRRGRRKMTLSRRPLPVPEKAGVADTDAPKIVKKRRPRRTVWRLLIRLTLVMAALIAIVLVFKYWDKLAPDALLEWYEDHFGGGKEGEGFPLTLSGDTVVSLQPLDKQMAVLTDTALMLINENAGEVARRSHAFADPLLQTAGKYALIAEIGGSRYQLETCTETVRTSQIDSGTILSGAVDEKGNVALAVKLNTQEYVSGVVIYAKAGKQLFFWKSSRLLVTALDLQADGHLAVTGFTAENGALKSSVMIFDYKNDQNNPYEVTQTDLLLCGVSFLSQETVAAVGDKETLLIDYKNRTVAKDRYADWQLAGFGFQGASVGLVLTHAGSLDGGQLRMLDRSGTTAYTASFTGKFRSLSPSSAGFYLLTNQAVHRMGSDRAEGQLPVSADSRLTADFRGRVLVLGLTSLNRYDWSA